MSVWAIALALAGAYDAYPRFPDTQVGSWLVSDSDFTCSATYTVTDKGVIEFFGPSFGGKEGPTQGSISTKIWPQGQDYPEKINFPVTVILGSKKLVMDGRGMSDFGMTVIPSSGPAIFDLLTSLPDPGSIRFMVNNRTVLDEEVHDTREAVATMQRCLAFITAQKRPGTRGSGRPAVIAPPPEIDPPVVRIETKPEGKHVPSIPSTPPVIGPNPVPKKQ